MTQRRASSSLSRSPGLPALRTLIAEQYPHLDLPMTGVVVTCGSQEAMTDAFMCCIDEGDEVLLGFRPGK